MRPVLILFCALVAVTPGPLFAQGGRMGPLAERASRLPAGFSPVIIQASDASALSQLKSVVQQNGGTPGTLLPIIGAQAAVMPNGALKALSEHALVRRISLDRATSGAMERTSATVGAAFVREQLGYDGSGVGVAVIDSGVAAWHDDLSSAAGGQRIAAFVDLVSGRTQPYDDYGHGTHVAGIVAGNGYDSSGRRSGIAPGASLVVLKALDAQGRGRISHVIAALDYVLAHRTEFNVRVVNLSLSAGVFEPATTDPLTLAAKAVVDAGIVVVAAAGNAGTDGQGHTQYGGISAPGNAPWVLTVGASSHMGTTDRADDTMASFSSRGPTPLDVAAKPDLVAPGVGIESLADPLSAFYLSKAPYLLDGTSALSYKPYLSLSGTSMATPVVAGTVALMLQANPALTPNVVKAILEYTAEVRATANRLTQGAGFLNAKGAVALSTSLRGGSAPAPDEAGWSRAFIWGNYLVKGGLLTANANAWALGVTWGAPFIRAGVPVQWGVRRGSGASWSTLCADEACTAVTWRGVSPNVVWGDACGGADCSVAWTPATAVSALSTTSEFDIVVWGTADTENQIVVWGTADPGDNQIVVWGTSGELEIVVWGTDCPTCAPVMWGR